MSKTHPSHHIFSFQNRPINTHCWEDDIPVQSSRVLTLTPLFLRPLMLWKPINWLLSNCLSFSLCPCPGLSVQTLHPARGDAGNAPELSRSKAHICSKVEDTQPLQLQRLRHICESGSSGHIGSVSTAIPNPVEGNIYKSCLPPSTSLACPREPGGIGMWRSARYCLVFFPPDWDSAAN